MNKTQKELIMTQDQTTGILADGKTDAERARQMYIDGEIDESELEERLDSESVLENDRRAQRRRSKAKTHWRMVAVFTFIMATLLFILTQGGQQVPL